MSRGHFEDEIDGGRDGGGGGGAVLGGGGGGGGGPGGQVGARVRGRRRSLRLD